MCTSFTITSKSNDFFWGKTTDLDMSMFGEDPSFDLDVQIATIPKGTTMKSQLDNWQSKYTMMGMCSNNTIVVYDGINEHGLTGGSQVLKESTCDTKENIIKNGKTPLMSEEFVGYILTNFKSVAEIRENCSSWAIVDQDFSHLGKLFNFSLHFTFIDKTGDGIILEPVNKGEFIAYDYIGTMTNSPEYSYHTTNIRNYIGLENTGISSKVFNKKISLDPIESGTGYGLLGMPGDYTSPSRFIRGFYYSNMLSDFDSRDGIHTLYSAFRPVIIPKGIEHSLQDPNNIDYTRYWVGYDVTNQSLCIQTGRGLAFTQKTLESNPTSVSFTPVNVENNVYIPA